MLDRLARSLATLSPGAPVVDREQAMRLVADLEDAEQRLGELIAELSRLAGVPRSAACSTGPGRSSAAK